MSGQKKRGNPITVRLVKGAYWDQETIKSQQNHWQQPVFNQKPETDINYENLIRLLLENHQYLYSAIASHNVRTQANAIAIAETLKIPKRRFECQILYGMGENLAKAIVKKRLSSEGICPLWKTITWYGLPYPPFARKYCQ